MTGQARPFTREKARRKARLFDLYTPTSFRAELEAEATRTGKSIRDLVRLAWLHARSEIALEQ